MTLGSRFLAYGIYHESARVHHFTQAGGLPPSCELQSQLSPTAEKCWSEPPLAPK